MAVGEVFWKNSLTPKRVYQNVEEPFCRDIFLYLSACIALIIRVYRADKYKNMSLH